MVKKYEVRTESAKDFAGAIVKFTEFTVKQIDTSVLGTNTENLGEALEISIAKLMESQKTIEGLEAELRKANETISNLKIELSNSKSIYNEYDRLAKAKIKELNDYIDQCEEDIRELKEPPKPVERLERLFQDMNDAQMVPYKLANSASPLEITITIENGEEGSTTSWQRNGANSQVITHREMATTGHFT